MSVRHPARVLSAIVAAAAAAAVLHVAVGSFANFNPLATVAEILRGPGHADAANSIVWDTRLPRALACLLAGGILGAVGSSFQALFRNPLADPYVAGVSSGAAVGGALMYVLGLGSWAGGLGMTVAGFATGLATLMLVIALARRNGVINVPNLLLGGVVVGSLLSSILSLVLLAAGQDTNKVLQWLLGDTSAADWSKDAVLFGALVIGAGILIPQTRRLNAFAVGGDSARRLGVDVNRLTWTVLIVGGGMTAAAVGTLGIIGFLGLVAPHLARRVVGVDWRWSLPGSMAVGALLLVASDVIAQRGLGYIWPATSVPFPVGIVTSLLGAPALLFLLHRRTRTA